jgi:hypothetical protein
MRLHPSFAKHGTKTRLPNEGGGAPKGANQPSAPHFQMSPSEIAAGRFARLSANRPARRGCAPRMLRCRESSAAGRAHLPALHRGFRRRANAFESVKAALHAIRRAQALPASLTALKPSTWHAGHNAGGDDARTARERSVWLRPREPPSLHFREYPRPKGPSQIQ